VRVFHWQYFDRQRSDGLIVIPESKNNLEYKPLRKNEDEYLHASNFPGTIIILQSKVNNASQVNAINSLPIFEQNR
jgi:hypothetical protein